MRTRIQRIVDESLDRVAGRGQMDLVADYACRVPVVVIFPEADRDVFFVLALGQQLWLGRRTAFLRSTAPPLLAAFIHNTKIHVNWVSRRTEMHVNVTFRRFLGRVSVLAVGLAAVATTAFSADGAVIRIAYLFPGPAECPVDTTSPTTIAFQRKLQEAGFGSAEQKQYCYLTQADVPARVREILDSKPSILLIWASPTAASAVKEVTSTLPVVFVDVADPVKIGLVKSLAHPGTNMTGVTNITEELLPKRIEILKEALPQINRLAVLGNLTHPDQSVYLRVIQEAAGALRIETRTYEVETQPDLAGAFAAMSRDRMQAVMLLPDPWFYPNRLEIVQLATTHRIPQIFGNTGYADVGGLLTYGPSLSGMSLEAAAYLVKILKGAKPGDLPVERPTQFDFIVNQGTARAIGVTVSPAALLRATKVIE
jgi:putative ABC transport system substrate-binding protein